VFATDLFLILCPIEYGNEPNPNVVVIAGAPEVTTRVVKQTKTVISSTEGMYPEFQVIHFGN
jgi:hypothetical protein